MNTKFKYFRQTFAILMLSLISLHGHATEIAKPSAIEGTFVQTKQFKALKRPFKSTGTYVYIRNQSFSWKTEHPVESTKLFTPNGIYNIDSQGNESLEAQLGSEFFFALIEADQSRLAAFFSIEKKQMCLHLTPTKASIQKLFSGVEVCLNENAFPTKIMLNDSSGNLTQIDLAISELDSKKVN